MRGLRRGWDIGQGLRLGAQSSARLPATPNAGLALLGAERDLLPDRLGGLYGESRGLTKAKKTKKEVFGAKPADLMVLPRRPRLRTPVVVTTWGRGSALDINCVGQGAQGGPQKSNSAPMSPVLRGRP